MIICIHRLSFTNHIDVRAKKCITHDGRQIGQSLWHFWRNCASPFRIGVSGGIDSMQKPIPKRPAPKTTFLVSLKVPVPPQLKSYIYFIYTVICALLQNKQLYAIGLFGFIKNAQFTHPWI